MTAAAAALLNPSLLKQGQKGVKMRTMLQDDDKFLEKELTTPLPPPSVKNVKIHENFEENQGP